MENQAYECSTCMENCKDGEECLYAKTIENPSLLHQWIDREIDNLTNTDQIHELIILQDEDPKTKQELVAYLEQRIAYIDEEHRTQMSNYEKACMEYPNDDHSRIVNYRKSLVKRTNILCQILTHITKK